MIIFNADDDNLRLSMQIYSSTLSKTPKIWIIGQRRFGSIRALEKGDDVHGYFCFLASDNRQLAVEHLSLNRRFELL